MYIKLKTEILGQKNRITEIKSVDKFLQIRHSLKK